MMSAPLEIFCCYAREDREMLTQLTKHLAPLVRQGQIIIWSDTDLNAGVEWEKELHQHLESADIILLLISPDFMNSDYCYSTEMGRALTRHNEGSAHVIPILLRATFWKNAPFAKLQVAPTDARYVTSWPDRDDAFHDITMQVNQVVLKLQAKQAKTHVHRYNGDQQERLGRQPEKARDGLSVPFFNPVKLTLLRTLTGHTDIVRNAVISPDGKTLATASRDKTIKLWDLPSGQELRTLTGHTDSVANAVFSSDGTLLTTAGQDRTIRFWEVSSGQELRMLTGHTSAVRRVAISPDGQILASASNDHTIRLWEFSSGRELHKLTSHRGVVTRVAISSDSKTLVSASNDKTIKLWELSSGRELRTLAGHTNTIEDIAISPNGTLLASGDSDKVIKLWELPTGQELHTLTSHTDVVWSVAFSPDNTILVSGSQDRTIRFWEVSSGWELHTFTGHPKSVGIVTLVVLQEESRSGRVKRNERKRSSP